MSCMKVGKTCEENIRRKRKTNAGVEKLPTCVERDFSYFPISPRVNTDERKNSTDKSGGKSLRKGKNEKTNAITRNTHSSRCVRRVSRVKISFQSFYYHHKFPWVTFTSLQTPRDCVRVFPPTRPKNYHWKCWRWEKILCGDFSSLTHNKTSLNRQAHNFPEKNIALVTVWCFLRVFSLNHTHIHKRI